MRRWFLLAFVSAVAFAGSVAERPEITIPKVKRAPQLSDFLEGREREAERKITGFRQREPQDGAAASRETTAYLSYDDHNLYVVFECAADPKTLRARLSKRDSVFSDETVNINIDTFHDRRRAYMFFVNPLGVQLDGITTEGQEDDYTFDTLWYSAGRVTERGYIVWMAIPFKSLRFSSIPGKTWGISLSRYLPERREYSSYPHITRKVEGFVEQFATLVPLEDVSPGRNIQLIPYVFSSRQHYLDTATLPQMLQRTEVRGGLDAKVVLKDQLTLDVTVNPDFSQVESDEPQVTVNQRFEVFFPERRPFFLENAGYFETPEQLFFSRRVVDPRWGSRLTGKAGHWAVGLLAMQDRGTVDGEGAMLGVARVQREIFQQSSIGAMLTTRQIGAHSNQVLSLDGRLRLTSNLVLTAQAVRSETRDPKEPEKGSAYFSELRFVNRHLTSFAFYRDRSRGFDAELGYIPRTDIRQVRNGNVYRWRPASGPVLSYGPGIYWNANWNHAGLLQDWSAEVPFFLEIRGPTSIEVSRWEGFERYQNIGFRKHNSSIQVASDYFRRFGLHGSFSQGDTVNYYPAAGVRTFGAHGRDASGGFTIRPNRRTRIDGTYLYSELRSQAATVYANHIVRTKINHQFSRTLSLRTIVDYNAVLGNPALVDLSRTKRLTTDVLFSYLLHPGTALHAGYSNRRENLPYPYEMRQGPPWTTTGSQIFVKLSYLLRF